MEYYDTSYRPRIVALFQKRVAHDTGEFAGDKDSQNSWWRIGLIGERLHGVLLLVIDRLPQRKPAH